jgi:hypothetical protein
MCELLDQIVAFRLLLWSVQQFFAAVVLFRPHSTLFCQRLGKISTSESQYGPGTL